MNGIGTMRWRRGLIVAVTVLGSLGFASAASAATYTVNDTRDFTQSVAGAAAGTCVSTASTCTLRSAIEAANENGGQSTINVGPGTYTIGTPTASANDLTTGDFKVNPGNNSTQITLVGGGIHSTVISGGGTDRIFEVDQNGVLSVSDLTLENGTGGGSHDLDPGDGGAINSYGHLTVSNVDFTGNSAASGDGGAIWAENIPGSTLSVTDSDFQNNTAPSGSGGAIYNETPNDATVSFTLFQSNSANNDAGAIDHGGGAAALTLNFDEFLQNVSGDEGGAVQDVSGGDLNITNSLFFQNQTTATSFVTGGGALWNRNDAITNVSNTSFDGNSSGWKGGAINDAGSNALNLTQDKFANNTSHQEGGALELHSDSASGTTITSSEFDGNSVQGGEDEGGAIDWAYDAPLALLGDAFVLNTAEYGGALEGDPGAPLIMEDTTMARNTASGYGGAIYMESDTPTTMFNDTIAFNNGGHGGGIAYADDFESNGTFALGVENTVIGENSGGDCTDSSGTAEPFAKTVDLGNNEDSDQTCFGTLGGPNDKVGVNPLLANPANNGGPAAGGPGDTEIVQTDAEASNGPTVDAGNNNGCPAVDARGVKRPLGRACDIGAYEFGANPTASTSTTTSTTTTSTTKTTSSATTTTSKSTVTTTTTSKPKPKPKLKPCPKGKVRKNGKCVKKPKKPKKHKK